MRKEFICDKILEKFKGNKTVHWEEVKKKVFYYDIDSNYYVVENHLIFLIGEGVLMENAENGISLSKKGWFMMTNYKTDGYQAKRKKDRNKLIWTIILGTISCATFIIVVFRFVYDFFLKK